MYLPYLLEKYDSTSLPSSRFKGSSYKLCLQSFIFVMWLYRCLIDVGRSLPERWSHRRKFPPLKSLSPGYAVCFPPITSFFSLPFVILVCPISEFHIWLPSARRSRPLERRMAMDGQLGARMAFYRRATTMPSGTDFFSADLFLVDLH